jgi:hypothetical protein
MVNEQNEDTLNYEQALRIIGRHLDAEPAYHVSILEVEDGYTVRYQPAQHQAQDRTVHYSHSRLRDLFVFHVAGRGCLKRRGRHLGIWGNFPSGHEDFFRAMGAALDREGACSLTVDELAEQVQISYVRTQPDDPLRTEKRRAVFGESDIRAMVEEAKLRRGRTLTLVKPNSLDLAANGD